MSTATDLERDLRDMFASDDVAELSRKLVEMASPDVVQEWPQSGERIRGLDNVIAVNEQYEGSTGTTPKMTLRRLLPPGDAWVVEGTIDYGDGTPVSLVSIIETDAAGKIVKTTDYFANPFEAPAWRSPFTEKIDSD